MRLGVGRIAAMGLLALSALGMTAATAKPPARPRPPNVIVILADDLGYGDTGVYGSKVQRTPNIDALAAGGTRFTQAYVSHPVCSPSRAGLLTGRYQERFGWEFNPVGRDEHGGMSLDETTIAQVMKSAGYRTGMVGKWHVGGAPGYMPSDRGFDDFFGMTAGGSTYFNEYHPGDEFYTYPGMEGAESLRKEPLPADTPVNTRLQLARKAAPIFRNHQVVDVPGYLTDAFSNEAVSFIDKNKDRPFFLYLAYNAPHVPLQAPKRYYDRFPEIKDKGPRIYAAMVSAMDDGIGQVMAKLKAEGLDKNTLVIFLSDNGCAGYVGPSCTNAPFSGYKGTHLEGGVRVPFILNWPGHVAAGKVDGRQVSSLDILPTAAALAHAQPPRKPLDGVNLMPLLGRAQTPNPTLLWRAGVNYAVRDGRWKMIVYNIAPKGTEGDGIPAITPDGQEAKVSPLGQHVMLYDLVADPAEKHNVAEANPKVVASLKARLSAWDKGLGKPQWTSMRQSIINYDHTTMELFD